MESKKTPFYEIRQKGTIEVWRTTKLEFPKHLHENVELCIILNGRVQAWAEGKGGIVREGNAFISFPNQVHHFKNEFGPADSIVAIFKAGAIPALSSIFLNKVPKSPIVELDFNLILPIINVMLSAKTNKSAHLDAVIASCLTIILAHIFENTQLQDKVKNDITALQSILIYCADNYRREISLDSMAKAIHLNKYYISHIFSKEIGISLPEYINALRVDDAEKLVAGSDMSITDIAFMVGFNSVRSFNRHFAAQMGLSPSALRAKSKNNEQIGG